MTEILEPRRVRRKRITNRPKPKIEVPNVNLIPQIKTRGITLADKAEYNALAREDLVFREDFDALCALEVPFYVSCCLWIFEPRESGDNRDVPFILRPFQEEFLLEVKKAIHEGYDVFIEKTREMGATWGILSVLNHGWMFETAFTAKVGSLTRDLIEKKDDDDALFTKLDYLVNSLKIDVPWLYPARYRQDVPYRTFMKMKNPVTRSVLTGQAPTRRFGRGGRQRCMLLDEFQEWLFQEESYTSCSKTTNCRIIVGTPNGPSNLYARLANPKTKAKDKAQRVDTSRKPRKKITLHWLVDPTKNGWVMYDLEGKVFAKGNGVPDSVPHGFNLVYPWYEEQKERFDYDLTKLAQEIDIDYNKSVRGQMYPMIERARMLDWIPFNPDLELYCVIDFGVEDACSIGWFQYNHFNRRWHMIDYYEDNGKSIKFYIPIMLGNYLMEGVKEAEDVKEYKAIVDRHSTWEDYYTDFYGDPAGRQRNPVTATSVIQELQREPFNIYVKSNTKARGDEERFNATRHFLPMLDINMKYCENFVEKIRASRWQKTQDNTEKSSKRKPVHDSTAHARAMLEFMAVNNPHVLDPQAPIDLKNMEADDYRVTINGPVGTLQRLLSGEVQFEEDRREDRSGYGVYD